MDNLGPYIQGLTLLRCAPPTPYSRPILPSYVKKLYKEVLVMVRNLDSLAMTILSVYSFVKFCFMIFLAGILISAFI